MGGSMQEVDKAKFDAAPGLINPEAAVSFFKRILTEVLDERNALFPSVDEETARKIAEINAKPFISVPEAVMLLGGSGAHFYKRIKLAESGQTEHPIPFRDLDGVYVLPREELLEWAKMHKGEKKKRKGRRKQRTEDKLEPGARGRLESPDFSGRSERSAV